MVTSWLAKKDFSKRRNKLLVTSPQSRGRLPAEALRPYSHLRSKVASARKCLQPQIQLNGGDFSALILLFYFHLQTSAESPTSSISSFPFGLDLPFALCLLLDVDYLIHCYHALVLLGNVSVSLKFSMGYAIHLLRRY